MKRTVLLLVLVLLGLAPAHASDESAAAESLRLVRLAMEAKLRAGDALLQAGDLPGALRSYEEAVALFREARAGRAEAARPATQVAEVVEGDALARALAWLAAYQDVEESGMWDCDGFAKHDRAGRRSEGPGNVRFDVGVTALATLAFLGAGFTDRGEERQNPYAKNVRMGLRFLMTSQDDEGCFGARASQHFIYNHALATMAMAEAFALTQNPRYKKPAQDGINFLLIARNPYLAWRYTPRGGENDTAVTSLCVVALEAGRSAGLETEPAAFAGALSWIDKMTDRDTGQVGYVTTGGASARLEGTQDRFPPEMGAAMTAAGILTRLLCGENPADSEPMRKGIALCGAKPPVWNPQDGSIDLYYWYLGAMALSRSGDPAWLGWRDALAAALEKGQRSDGSLDPIDPWGGEGGRVYSTAVAALCLRMARRGPRAG
ncbi:MAG: hypothetical protein ACT4PV_10970 [Planctomycetaceae bacterium]